MNYKWRQLGMLSKHIIMSLISSALCSHYILAESNLDHVNQKKYCSTCEECGTIAFPTTYNTPNPIIHSPEVWSFVSEPNLHPMKIQVNKYDKSQVAPGFIFLSPYAFSDTPSIGQQGSLIMDSEGIPFWFRPTPNSNIMNNDFRVQKLHGEHVLTYWQGTLVTPPAYTNFPAGSSEPGSCFYILDKTYKVIKTVTAQKGFISDIHEFLLTPNNTALFLSTKTIQMDLTPYGGPASGYIQDFAIQEIDLKTNKLIFFWDALEHIPLSASYEPVPDSSSSNNIWDVYHLNSIGLTDDENDIIISSRSTWTIYKINKPTGNIIWELGGKQSSFTLEEGADFSWQHDARMLSSNLISLFNDNSDGSTSGSSPSHGLILKLDFEQMKAFSYKSYFHNPNITVASQGNLQSLKNGNKFIGWGQSQYFSEFINSGNTEADPSFSLIYDAQMPTNNYSYRAYREKWIGNPYYPPSLAIEKSNKDVIAYASWNGATEVFGWNVYAGKRPNKLKKIRSKLKTGFETAIKANSNGPFFQVKAFDKNGKVIGSSKTIKYKG